MTIWTRRQTRNWIKITSLQARTKQTFSITMLIRAKKTCHNLVLQLTSKSNLKWKLKLSAPWSYRTKKKNQRKKRENCLTRKEVSFKTPRPSIKPLISSRQQNKWKRTITKNQQALVQVLPKTEDQTVYPQMTVLFKLRENLNKNMLSDFHNRTLT